MLKKLLESPHPRSQYTNFIQQSWSKVIVEYDILDIPLMPFDYTKFTILAFAVRGGFEPPT